MTGIPGDRSRIRRRAFRAAGLHLVEGVPVPLPALAIGMAVRLASGGPGMIVVDLAPGRDITAAWRSGGVAVEHAFPAACLRPAAAAPAR